MALVKFDTSRQFNFLQDLLENAEQILNEYEENKSKLYIYETPGCLGWWVTTPYRFGMSEDSKYLPTTSKILSSIKNLTTVMISDVHSNLPQGIHAEGLPEGVRRFHVPIKFNQNARLNVLENGSWVNYEWSPDSVFEFENFYDRHYISCPEGDNRIVLMVDVFDGVVTEEMMDEIEKWYDAWISSVGYHKVELTSS